MDGFYRPFFIFAAIRCMPADRGCVLGSSALAGRVAASTSSAAGAFRKSLPGFLSLLKDPF
jgi:hypothetical protein